MFLGDSLHYAELQPESLSDRQASFIDILWLSKGGKAEESGSAVDYFSTVQICGHDDQKFENRILFRILLYIIIYINTNNYLFKYVYNYLYR